ncbi:DUF4276 family protein [Kineococcus arenarius]|uniref:DUF4276 family protein n=1 Tax=unclassified Kineococcus TaxID=2621656 RepID=UPI003D7E39A9
MRYLAAVVLLEGRSDEEFLPVVVQRSLQDLCHQWVEAPVEVDVRPVVVSNPSDVARPRWIVDRARRERPHVVLLHVDGSADVARELRKSFEPVAEAWRRGGGAAQLLPLVPVREMEAWALADRRELERVVGAGLDASRIHEADRLATPENLSDPKATLRDVAALGVRPRRRAPGPEVYLPLLAERIPLESLRTLPSFRAFEHDIENLLDTLGWRTRDR